MRRGKRCLLWVTVGCELDLVQDTSSIEQTGYNTGFKQKAGLIVKHKTIQRWIKFN
jgi:hypothetical protein